MTRKKLVTVESITDPATEAGAAVAQAADARLGTKVNTATYTAGLAGKQDKATLGADVAGLPELRAASVAAVQDAITAGTITAGLTGAQVAADPTVRGTFVPTAAPMVRSYIRVERASDAGTSYSFPARLRGPEPTRRRCVIRNLGVNAVRVASPNTGDGSYNGPSGTQWTAGVVINPGEEAALTGTAAIFVRPNTSGQAYSLGVLAETGAF